VSRVFLSHSSRDSRQAVAVKKWLIEHEPGLAEEIFLDLDPHTGIRPGERWKQALNRANDRCEAVICLLSESWERSSECKTEYRHAEDKHKAIVCARLEPVEGSEVTSEWQHCDIFPDHGPTNDVDIGDGGKPVVLATEGLQRLLDGLRALGIGAEHFPWPPPNDPDRAPYRGWAPLGEVDAAVFFGRDAQIVLGLDDLRGMRTSGFESLFVILGPSGVGKSSFVRAGLLPRLRRDDRNFVPLPIVRPERAVLTGDLGLAHAIHELRTGLGLHDPMLGEIKNACHPERVEQVRSWLEEARHVARARLLDVPAHQPAPTLVLPMDQAEELFNADAGPEAPLFLELLAALVAPEAGVTPAMIVAVTIRTDRYEPLQIAPQLTGVHRVVFDELKPLPPAGYKDVITGPARRRATTNGRQLTVEPGLVDRLLAETADGADALPLLALTLERLYHDYGADGDLTVAEYESLGGLAQVVQTEVDNLLATEPDQREAQLDTLHDAFIPWLARINPDNDQPMRRLARWDDLPAASRPLIQAMVEKRLLVKDTRDGQVVVEVALESLLRQWRELAAWLRDEAQDLKDADSLEREANDWQANDRDESWLVREGTRLQEAENLAAKPRFRDRLDLTREFLHASRKRENDRIAALRKRNRILAALLAITVVIAVAAVYGFVTATNARKQADERTREAVASKLTSQGEAMLAGVRGGGAVRALQDILTAPRIAPTADVGAQLTAVMTLRDSLNVIPTPDVVRDVAVSPDGRRIVSGGNDNRLQIWDADTTQQIGQPLTGNTAPVSSVAFSPDGRRIVSGSDDGTLRVWDADTGKQIGQPLTGHTEMVRDVAFSPDGRRIVSGSLDKTVRVWDADTTQQMGQTLTGHTDSVRSVAFSRDGKRILSGSNDHTVRVWDADTGKLIGQPLTGHTSAVIGVAFSPDGRRIVSWSAENTLGVWDADTGKLIRQPLTGHTHTEWDAEFSPDGKRIVSTVGDTLQIWDADTGGPIGAPLTGHHTFGANCVAFSPDGRRIVSGSSDNQLRIWDADTGKPVVQSLTGHTDAVWSVAASPDGRIISGSLDHTVRLWDIDTGKLIGQPLTGHTDSVRSVAFSRDGKRIVSGGDDDKLRVWDADNGKPVGQPLTGHTDAVWSVAVSPDGRRIVSGSLDKTVGVWDIDTGKLIGQPLTGHTGPVRSVAFSRDGKRIVSGGDDDKLRVWDADTGKPVGQPLTGHSSAVTSVAFSPDGRRIVSGSSDKTLRIWDADTGQQIGPPLTGHTTVVQSVAFSPDGRRIVSGSDDETLRVWDANTGQQIGPPITGGGLGQMYVATFSPDGRRIVSGSAYHMVWVWPGPAAWPDLLCAKLTTNMSHKQWREWVSPDIDYIKACPDLPVAPD
jgi:WD40 repeat protein